MQVVVYEDNLFFATRLDSRLRELGFIPELASTRKFAESLPGKGTIAIIVDLHAPEVFDFISSCKKSLKTPVIAFCGHSEVDLRKQAKEAGVDVLLPNSELIAALDPVLSRLESGQSAAENTE